MLIKKVESHQNNLKDPIITQKLEERKMLPNTHLLSNFASQL